MANKFDDFSRRLASTHTRRGALKLVGASLAGAAFAAFRPKSSEATFDKCFDVCLGHGLFGFFTCVRACKCESLGREFCGVGPSAVCCPENTFCSITNGTFTSNSVVQCIPSKKSKDKKTKGPKGK
jgi:hypothetical protein